MARHVCLALCLLGAFTVAGWLALSPSTSDAHIVAGEYSLDVEAPDAPVAVNDQFEVLLGIFHEIPDGYRGVQWYLEYDEAIVDVVAMPPAAGAPPECVQESDNGERVLLACSTPFEPNGLTFSGWAWAIVFRCLEDGATTFELVAEQNGFPTSFVTSGIPHEYEPRHVHSDAMECSVSAPTATPAPSPTPAPVVTPTGDIYHLAVEVTPEYLLLGESFIARTSIESENGSPYRAAQWDVHFDPSIVMFEGYQRAPAADPSCNAFAAHADKFLAACATDVTNGLEAAGATFEVQFTCISPGVAAFDLLSSDDGGVSKVFSGEFGNSFEEAHTVTFDSITCVDPLPPCPQIVARALLSHRGDRRWNPVADLNQNGVVDVDDLISAAHTPRDCRSGSAAETKPEQRVR